MAVLLLSWLVGGCALLGPPLNIESMASQTQVELAHVPHHPQDDFYCGPASLLSLLESTGLNPDFSDVVDRVYLPQRGGSLQVELMAASRYFGRIAYPLPARPEALIAELEAGRPVLILQNLSIPERPLWHYAVVIGFDGRSNRFLLHSGDQPRMKEPARRWMRQWDWAGRWAMIALEPGQLPANPDRQRLIQATSDFESAGTPVAINQAWQAVLDWDEEEPIAWLGLGNNQYRQGNYAQARDHYERLLELAPEHLPGRLNLAQSLTRLDQPCQALEVLQAASPDEDHPLADQWKALMDQSLQTC